MGNCQETIPPRKFHPVKSLTRKAHRVTNGHVAKDSEIKFRCDGELRARFERLAILERRSESDLARIIFEDYVNQMESKLGLTHYGLRDASSGTGLAAAKELVDVSAARARAGATALPVAKPPTKYKVARRSRKKPPA